MSSPTTVLTEIVEEAAALPAVRQPEVLDFVLFLKQREVAARWEAISDQEAAQFQAEFAAEDRLLAERATEHYLTQLQREDGA
ncbi:MAG TPA: hypothetical protein VFF59_03505 [Anaerolineae bacterium]|nr:hypothetical protein [Anaerolineae bacterium]